MQCINAQNRGQLINKTTGWKVKDTDFDFINSEPQYPLLEHRSEIIPEGCVYIPGGTFISGDCTELVYTHNDSTLWAEPDPRRITVASFIMKETEVTNREYREFVNWVRDSIARTLLYDSPNLNSQHYINVDIDGNYLGLNWDEPIDWNDTIALNSMYIPPEEQSFVGHKGFDARILIYKMDGEDVLIYPDTICWIRDFPFSWADPFASKYFWDTAFDNYPVVGVSLEQAKAYCQWKTKIERKQGLPFGDYRLPTATEYEFAAIRPKKNAEADLSIRFRYCGFTWIKNDDYNYQIYWDNSDCTDNVVPKKEKKRKKYYRDILKNNITFLTNFNTKGVISENGQEIVKCNADGFVFSSPVGFYDKNYEGLYDLQGNVAEWTSSFFYPNNIIRNSLTNLSFCLNFDYYSIYDNELKDNIKDKMYCSRNAIEFLRVLPLLKVERHEYVEKDVEPVIETPPSNIDSLNNDGKIKFTEKYKKECVLVLDSISYLTIGRNYIDDSIFLAIPIDSITDRNWIKHYINVSKGKIANTISDESRKIEFYKKVETDTYHLFLILDRIDEVLIRSKRFLNRFAVKGGSWAHTIDHTNPFVDNYFQPEKTHSFIGFRYVATVLEYPDYNNDKP